MTLREIIQANPSATDAQILALAQGKATVRPIDRSKLANAARASGAIVRLRGVLTNGTAQQKTAAQDVLDLITYGDDTLRTDVFGSNEFAVLANPNGFTLAERTAIAGMAGGLMHADATVDTVVAVRAAMTRDSAIDSLWQLAVDEYNPVLLLHQQRNSKLADLRNDPNLPVPATLAELDGGQ